MAHVLPLNASLILSDGSVNWPADTIVCALATAAYTPSTSHTYLSSITNELSGGGYARVALSGKAKADNSGAARVEWTAADVVFPSLSSLAGQPRYAILAKSTGLDSTSPVLAIVDLSISADAPSGTDYTVAWASGLVISRPYFADDATRADATTIGGTGWTSVAGAIGISSNQFYMVTAGGGGTTFAVSYQETGTADHTVRSKIAVQGTQPGIVFRLSDASNYWVATYQSGGWRLYKVVAGTATQVGATYTALFSANDVVSAVCFGTSINIYVNGTIAIPATGQTFNQSATKAGLALFGATCRQDDYRHEGALTIQTATATAADAACYATNQTPQSGEAAANPYAAVEWDFVTADLGDPVRLGSLGFTIDGVEIVFTHSAITGGYHLIALPPLDGGRTYTAAARGDTAATAGSPSVTTWSFTTRFMAVGYAAALGIVPSEARGYATALGIVPPQIAGLVIVAGLVPVDGVASSSAVGVEGLVAASLDLRLAALVVLQGWITQFVAEPGVDGVVHAGEYTAEWTPGAIETSDLRGTSPGLEAALVVSATAAEPGLDAAVESVNGVVEPGLEAAIQAGQAVAEAGAGGAVEVEGAEAEALLNVVSHSLEWLAEEAE